MIILSECVMDDTLHGAATDHYTANKFNEVLGKPDDAQRELLKAKRLRIAHYMGDVAVVHADLPKVGTTPGAQR